MAGLGSALYVNYAGIFMLLEYSMFVHTPVARLTVMMWCLGKTRPLMSATLPRHVCVEEFSRSGMNLPAERGWVSENLP